MRLGANVEDYLESTDPEAFVAECCQHGYRAASWPGLDFTDKSRIEEIKNAFEQADILIAEVPAWVNPLHPEPEKKQKNLKTIEESLVLADELEAVCCATVVGSLNGTDAWDSHVGQHPDNFTDTVFDAVVQWVRKILNQVKPQRTKLTLEMSPWTLLDGPEEYLRLLKAVDHPALAVHLDPTNAVRDPRSYYSTTEIVNRCFDLLGPWICSCHAKDCHYALDARTVAIEEVIPGKGILDYRTYIKRIEELSPDTPLIVEHLGSEANYLEATDFIRGVAGEVGASQ